MKNKNIFVALAIVLGLSSFYTPKTTMAAQLSVGSHLRSSNGTVYLVTTDNPTTKDISVKRPYTSAAAYLSYSYNSWAGVQTNSSDDNSTAIGSPIPPRDGTIICSDRGSDKGVCYLVTAGKKAAFTNESIFKQLGYSFKWAFYGDVSFLETDTNIDSTTAAHRVGTPVNKDGTIYLVGEDGLHPFPNWETFKMWGYWDGDIVQANSADRSKPVVSAMASRKAGQIKATPTTTVTVPSSDILQIKTELMKDGIAGTDYSQTFKASGGTAPYTWENYSTTHPCCYVGIKPKTGVFSNSGSGLTPLAGTWQIGIKVTDKNGKTASKIFSWKVAGSSTSSNLLNFSTTKFPDATVGRPYTNGVNYTYSGQGTLSGTHSALPAGFTQGTIVTDGFKSTGRIMLTGLPTQAGTYSVIFNVSDGVGMSITKTFTIKVKGATTTTSGTPIGTTTNGFTATVLSPNGGETWTSGSTKNITWSGSTQANSVTIYLINSEGTGQLITSSIPDTGSYSWNVGKFDDQFVEGTQYKIRILIYHNSGVTVDESDNFFTIP